MKLNTDQQKLLFPFFLVLFEVCAYLSNDMYLPTLTRITQDFQTSTSLVQLTLSMWFLGSSSMQLLIGPLSDRFGRKIMLLIGGVVFILSSALCAFAPNIETLLVARLVQGTTVCFVIVAGYGAINELYSSTRAIQILATMASVMLLAPTLGPILGAIMMEFTTWRNIFLVLAIFGTLVVSCLCFIMPETCEERHSLNIKNILIGYKALVTNKSFTGLTVAPALTLTAFFIWIVETPFIMIGAHHKDPIYFATAQAFVCMGFIVGNWITKHAITKYKVDSIIKSGLFLAAAGAFLMAISSYYGLSIPLITASMVIISTGFAITASPLGRLSIDSSSEPMGRKMAINSSMFGGFGAIGTLATSLIPGKTFATLSMVLLPVILCSVAIYLCVDKTKFPEYHGNST